MTSLRPSQGNFEGTNCWFAFVIANLFRERRRYFSTNADLRIKAGVINALEKRLTFPFLGFVTPFSMECGEMAAEIGIPRCDGFVVIGQGDEVVVMRWGGIRSHWCFFSSRFGPNFRERQPRMTASDFEGN
jgi:hypothetical protein